MTTTAADLTVQGETILVRTLSAGWSRIPLTCPCGERTGLTISTARGQYVCPSGHVTADPSLLVPDVQVRHVGPDLEVVVPAGGQGQLSSRPIDPGDGDDDFRDLPL